MIFSNNKEVTIDFLGRGMSGTIWDKLYKKELLEDLQFDEKYNKNELDILKDFIEQVDKKDIFKDTLDSKYEFNENLSGKKSKDNKEGIYLTFENKNSKDDKIEYYYIIDTLESGITKNNN